MSVLSRTLTVLTSLALGVSLTACDPDVLADPGGSLGDVDTTDLAAAIDALPIAAEHRDGYDRDRFKHWIDADHNGCDTRKEVLIAEDLSGRATEDDCGKAIHDGEWLSEYDGETVTDGSDLDVDHLVPLAEAWDSGAWQWDDDRRTDFANDLEHPEHLVAVTAASNRSKSDQDPAEWLPSDESAVCGYVADWVAVKSRWDLTVDQAEHDALIRIAGDC